MQKVAIIGSGPAGLACAETLLEAGFSVSVFDELSVFGGMPAYGLPEFRSPMKNSIKKIELIKNKGVLFKKERVSSVKNLLSKEGFDFVVLAIGAGSGKKLSLPGEESSKVIDSLALLLESKVNNIKLLRGGEKVCVIGGGNSAIDAVREALRQTGKGELIYRRTEKEMPAFGSELEEAKNEGVIFTFLRAPIGFKETKNGLEIELAEMKLGKEDANGRREVTPTEKIEVRIFDKAILAVGQKLDTKWLEKEGIACENGKILVDEKNKTLNDFVYACGDCVTGAKNIASATVAGIKTAKSIISSAKKS